MGVRGTLFQNQARTEKAFIVKSGHRKRQTPFPVEKKKKKKASQSWEIEFETKGKPRHYTQSGRSRGGGETLSKIKKE